MEPGTFLKVANEAIQLSCVLMNGITFATFQNVPVSIQMVRTLLFINQILQVWYQNEEDVHLLPVICF